MRDTDAPDDDPGAASTTSRRRHARWPGSASTPAGRTRPRDYALINGVYAAALAGVVHLASRPGAREPVPLRELPAMGMAAFALSDVLAKQKVTTWLREPFVEESADHKPVRPEGSGFQHALGELLTCTRCVGSWAALGLVGLRLAAPEAGRSVSAVMATAGVNQFLQAGFALLCETTDKTKAQAQAQRGT